MVVLLRAVNFFLGPFSLIRDTVLDPHPLGLCPSLRNDDGIVQKDSGVVGNCTGVIYGIVEEL